MSRGLSGLSRFLKSHGIQDVESLERTDSQAQGPHGRGVLGCLFQEFKKVERLKVEIGESKKRISTSLLVSAFLAVLLTFPDVECNYRSRRYYDTHNGSVSELFSSTPVTHTFIGGFAISIVITLLSILTTGLLYRYYQQELDLLKIRHRVPDNTTLWKLPSRYQLAVELVVSFFHVPPMLHLYVPPELQLVVFLRTYHLFRFLKNHNTIGKSASIRLLVSFMQKDLSDAFQVKSFFMKHPFIIIFTLYMFDALVVGYVVFALDRAAGMYRSYKDITWLMVVTMTSLGFGDVTPNSVGGRVFVSLTSIFGILLMALVIGVVQQLLTLTEDERRVLAWDEHNRFIKNRKVVAARCIQAVWRIHNCERYGRYKGLMESESAQRLRFKQLLHSLYVNLNDWRQVNRFELDWRLRDSMAESLTSKVTNVDRKMDTLETKLAHRRRSSVTHGGPIHQVRKDSVSPAHSAKLVATPEPPPKPSRGSPATTLPPITGRVPLTAAAPAPGGTPAAPGIPEGEAIEAMLRHLEQLEQRMKTFVNNAMEDTAAIRLMTGSVLGHKSSKTRREKDGLPQLSLPSLMEEA